MLHKRAALGVMFVVALVAGIGRAGPIVAIGVAYKARMRFHAAGHEGQFVTVVPSRDVGIVRLGRTRRPKARDHCGFVRDVLAALSDGAIRPGI